MFQRRTGPRRSLGPAAAIGLVAALLAAQCLAQDDGFRGRSLVDAIAALEARGLVVYYSSDLVRPWMIVREEPVATEPEAVLDEILRPFGLAARPGPENSLLVVRREEVTAARTGTLLGVVRHSGTGRRVPGLEVTLHPGEARTMTSPRGQFSYAQLAAGTYRVEISGDPALATGVDAEVEAGRITVLELAVEGAGPRRLETVVVSASRYALVEPGPASPHFLPVERIEALPDLGDDPMRAVARLPGTASGGFTAKTHIRGGERNETLVLLDGLRLRNPFHLKDFQSIFSAVDPGIVSSMEVYTGGGPPRYGDRMSGVVEISSLEVPVRSYNEVSQSLFNSSVLSAGSRDDGRVDWVAAARRGNLDLLLNAVEPRLGEPSYVDLFGRFGVQATDRLRVTGNVLVFDDDIVLSDSDQEENAEADYRDRYFWVRFDHARGGGMEGYTLLAHTDLSSNRRGEVEQSGIAAGRLEDRRSFSIDSLTTEWTWQATDRLRWSAGAELAYAEGDYDYVDEVEFDVLFDTPGAPRETERSREIHLRPSGEHYAAWINARWAPAARVTADLGLRWDKDTLTEDDETLVSPRLGLMVRLGERTALRAGWGRHFQSQGINELQVSDGVTRYFRAQRADHLVLSLEHRTAMGLELRAEAYRKDMDRLRPRFENLLNDRILLPELKPDRILLAPDSARAHGLELSVARRDQGPIGWWLSYTWSEVEDRFDGRDVPRSWDQRRSFQAGLDWTRGPWRLTVAGSHHSGWPTTAVFLAGDDPVPLVGTGPRNGERLGSFRSLDARLAREWRLPDSRLTAFVEVSNALDRRNPCCVEYEFEEPDDEEGIEEGQLDLQRLDYFRVFPSIGFTWRF